MKATLELTPKSVWEEKATTINNAQTRTAKGVTEQKKMACMTSTSHRQFRLSRDYRESSDQLLWDEQTWLTALWLDGFSCWVVTRKVLGGTETPDGGGGGWEAGGGGGTGGGGGNFIAGGNWSLTRATAHDDDEGQTFKETQAQNAVFTEGWVFFYEG